MPYTPFHFGPGLLLKGAMPTRFSFLAFSTAQVVIDLESWYYLTNGDAHPHRILHTFLVGGAAGATTGAGIWLIGAGVRRVLANRAATLPSIGAVRPIFQAEVTRGGAILGGLLGGLTHALFDGLVHRDIQPLLPFASFNPFEGLIGWDNVHRICLIAGVIGFALAIGRRRFWMPTPGSVPAASTRG